jgi:hypothetical protein
MLTTYKKTPDVDTGVRLYFLMVVLKTGPSYGDAPALALDMP